MDGAARCNPNMQSEKTPSAGNFSYNDDDDNEDDADHDDRFSQPPHPNNAIAAEENQCFGISLYSIASLLRDHHRSLKNNDRNSAMRSSCANDVVAVVLSMTTRQSPTPTIAMAASHGQHSCITLLISDQSLPSGKCARVTVPARNLSSSLVGLDGMGGRSGRSEISSDLSTTSTNVKYRPSVGRLGELQPGDVVRLNRLEVRHDYDSVLSCWGKKRKLADENNDNKDALNHPLLSVSCDLTLSWKDPAPGPALARLCRIIPKSSNKIMYDANLTRNNQNQCVNYALEWEMIIPPTLDTPKEVVTELANWYCANIVRHRNSKSTSIFRSNQRCQRRKLRDITAPNMLSNIVVKVLRCERVIPLLANPIRVLENPDVTHATLSDGPGSDDIFGMVGFINNMGHVSFAVGGRTISKSISSVMLQSMNIGAHVLLTHVLSQAPIGNGASSLILVPTNETTATILTPDHPYFVNEHYHSTRGHMMTSDSQELIGTTKLSLSSSPEEMNCDSIIPSIHSRGIVAITAPLLDIVINGVSTSFMEGSHWKSPYALSQFLIDVPRISNGMNSFCLNPSYRSAALILDRKKKSVAKKSGHEEDIVVHACGDAMKLLCLDVPVEDMVMKDIAAGSVDTLHHPYLIHVGDLLRTLCSKNIPIQWVLEQESECNWFVMNATIIEV